MSFLKHRAVQKNFDLFSTCSWYTPNVGGLFAVLGWFLVGLIIAGILTVILSLSGLGLPYIMLIIYPVQFIPVFIFVRLKSSQNSAFDRGYALDSRHFGKAKGFGAALLVIIGTLSLSFMTELLNSALPEMNEQLMKSMEAMLNGPLWVSLLTTCVFAPVLEEWLCRGVILRGLLNYSHKDGLSKDESGRGMSPALAIFISALFFAAIHGNYWQGLTALLIGSLFGYVYYRTGSLKLTMLMHCTNNLLAVLLTHFGGEKVQEAKSMLDIMPSQLYFTLFAIAAVILVLVIFYFSKIQLTDPHGNCDVIPSAEEEIKAEKAEAESMKADGENL
jgi:membrane protease YdiL (CAAX protease family)